MGIENWLYHHKEEIDFWSLAICLGALIYGILRLLHTGLVVFLGFTGLKWAVMAIVCLAAGRTATLFYDEWKENKDVRD